MKYYIIAGEASGDLHAARLIAELKKLDNNSQFRGWGGDKMEAEGLTLVKHYRDLAFMGFTEVLMNIRTIFKNLTFCKKEILEYQPDVLILVDYPGFNLRIAEFAFKEGIKVFYYISPQVWAWKKGRIKQIEAFVDRMYVILPFEKQFYKDHGIEVDFAGHPLLDHISRYNAEPGNTFRGRFDLGSQPLIAILPGSRKQEVKRMLPIMLEAAASFKDYTFVVGAAPGLDDSFFELWLKQYPNVKVVRDATYTLLTYAHAALVTSGTASLETALFSVPEVICYKGGWLSYFIARMLIKIKFIGLANLIMDKGIVREMIQGDLTVKALERELDRLINDKGYRGQLQKDYADLKQLLGGSGSSERTAQLMFDRLNTSKS